MREYLYTLTHHDELETVVLPVGDGATLSVKLPEKSRTRSREMENEESKSDEKPELLIPAGSLEVLKTAVNFGADAVYIGGEAFGLRAKAKNFSPEDMAEGIAYAHDRGVKVYVTANILAHNGDLEAASDYLWS